MDNKLNDLLGSLQDKQFVLQGKARVVFAIWDLLFTVPMVDTVESWERYEYELRN